MMLNEICENNLKKPEISINVISVLIQLAENKECATVMSENRIIQTTAQTMDLCLDNKDLTICCLSLLNNLIKYQNYTAFAETTLISDCANLLRDNVKYAVDNCDETIESQSAVEIVHQSLRLLCGMLPCDEHREQYLQADLVTMTKYIIMHFNHYDSVFNYAALLLRELAVKKDIEQEHRRCNQYQ